MKQPLTSLVYRANAATTCNSFRVGIGIYMLYQGITRIIFTPTSLSVGIVSGEVYGILQMVTALLILYTAGRLRCTVWGYAAVAAAAGAYAMIGMDVLLRGSILSGGGALILAALLIFFELAIPPKELS